MIRARQQALSREVAKKLLITFINTLINQDLVSVESLKQLNQKVLTLGKIKTYSAMRPSCGGQVL